MSAVEKLLKGWMLVCTVAVTLFLLFYGPYILFLWVANDRNPHFEAINQCLDSGGTWNDQDKICVHAS